MYVYICVWFYDIYIHIYICVCVHTYTYCSHYIVKFLSEISDFSCKNRQFELHAVNVWGAIHDVKYTYMPTYVQAHKYTYVCMHTA